MNEQIFFAIKTGVISGILTGVVLWSMRQFILKVILPYLEQYFYTGTLLDGTWNAIAKYRSSSYSSHENSTSVVTYEQERNLILNLRQNGTKISGTFYAKSETKKIKSGIEKIENEYSNQYKIEGIITNNYLILNYKALSRNRTGLGSFVLQITHGGTKLKGGISFIGEGGESIETLNRIEFIRSI